MDYRIVGILFIALGSGLLFYNLKQEETDQMRVYVSMAMIGYGVYRTYQGFQQQK